MRRREILSAFLVAGFLVFWLGHHGRVGLGPWIREETHLQATLPNDHTILPALDLPHRRKDSTVPE